MLEYVQGVAFIVEGATERVFYEQYIRSAADERLVSTPFGEESEWGFDDLMIAGDQGDILVRFNNVGTVTQMPNSAAWFKRSCRARWPSLPWTVFLCYDTDSYDVPISKFQSESWNLLRKDLEESADEVIEIAAAADIEDVMLADFEGVLRYLGLDPAAPLPSGGKGKSRMRKLFKMRSVRHPYHEGEKALPLIQTLDMRKICAASLVPLGRINEVCGFAERS
ncbi:hypothetical protein VJ918_03035 [Adlercreutzia sp. R21]|uniref:DUF4276 family protein n=1 Tax=Adlercreutzia wanghongyangiae TaxID=3111451 RepID=A0ABU6IH10_9ACTN|nr:hypothetical protein [Adlercreutzia sp. R21]MEC4175739.1 hypothetical protein [Adlercreutzia sp. R7]MEC4183776.1 hypothetical protein [Adlercreutzia sp. R21]